MSKGTRIVPHNLNPAERRVLDAFYGGRLPAGKLSAALSVARTSGARAADQRTQATAALRLAA